MIGTANDGLAVSITGLGCKVPDRVVTNDELAEYVDTSNEWILERTGIRERRMASQEEALGDGAGAVVIEAVPEQGFLGFELGADGGGGASLWLPGSGSRLFDDPDKYVKMNGREVFKFATRILVQSAEDLLERCGVTVDQVDVYVPHQANMRIIDHATRKLGVPSERVVINVDRYGNTSSGSIPLALADAAADGRLQPGKLVLMTGMGAGLTWGSALLRWTTGMQPA